MKPSEIILRETKDRIQEKTQHKALAPAHQQLCGLAWEETSLIRMRRYLFVLPHP